MMVVLLCSKMKACRTFWVYFCNVVIYDKFANEVVTLVNLASAVLMHTDPAKDAAVQIAFT